MEFEAREHLIDIGQRIKTADGEVLCGVGYRIVDGKSKCVLFTIARVDTEDSPALPAVAGDKAYRQ